MSENYYTKSTKHSEKEKRRIELSPFLNSSIYEIITIDSLDLVFFMGNASFKKTLSCLLMELYPLLRDFRAVNREKRRGNFLGSLKLQT